MSGITAVATGAAGLCPQQAARLQPTRKRPVWRGSPGTWPSAPRPAPAPPPRPLAPCARAPVLLHLLHLPPVHEEHAQPPPVWTKLARASCRRWYCPDCLSPPSFRASLPSSPVCPPACLFPFPLASFLFNLSLSALPLLFLLRRGTVRYL